MSLSTLGIFTTWPPVGGLFLEDLSEAILSSATLRNADLSNSSIWKANFSGADLSCRNVINCELDQPKEKLAVAVENSNSDISMVQPV